MPRIVVPLMRDRVAPYYGHCDELLIIEKCRGAVRRSRRPLRVDDPADLSRMLAGLNVQKLICGGIWFFHKERLAALGIEVIENRIGSVEDVFRWEIG